jgi:hypothetical protein
MADLTTDTFRKYQEDGSSRAPGTAITLAKSRIKTDYSSERGWHPDNPINEEYIAAGAAKDHDRPLCWAVHDGIVCRRPVRRGRHYCREGRGDA